MTETPRILICEDELVVALDLERRLRKLGFDIVATVASGEAAVAETRKVRPDLVLMDICLAGEADGIEAASRIRSERDVPVIFLTANADEATLARAKQTQPANYLLKPFRERELQICIEMALMNDHLRRALRQAHDTLERRVRDRTAELAQANEALRREITVRQEAEKKTRDQAALLDKARDAILVRNLEGTIEYWNRSAERLYQIARERALGRRFQDLVSEVPVRIDEDPVAATLAHGEWTGELHRSTGTGRAQVLESRWTLVVDSTGRPASFLIVNTDVTEKKQVEAQFLRAQRLESVGALASGIAHDLNNVFTPLIMMAQSLEEDPSAGSVQNLAEIIVTSSRRGASMVKQILTFVRGTEGEHTPFRLEHLAREVQRLLRETFPRTIRIQLRFAPDLWSVLGDAGQLHQLLMNLCVNARDAMERGGELTLTLENVHADAAFAGLQGTIQPGDYLRLTVSDTGCGMPKEVLDRIFEPFFTTKGAGQGTGLGLATVQAIVREHRGSLQVESTPGAGTRFHVLLPASRQAAAAPGPQAAVGPRGNGEWLLAVDDELTVREITCASLKANGYHVVPATDGVDALAQLALRRDQIAAVVLDWTMPSLDGLGAIRGLRQIRPGIPIVLVTGRNQTDLPNATLAELGVVYLAKPYSRGQLFGAVHDALQSRSASPAPAPAG